MLLASEIAKFRNLMQSRQEEHRSMIMKLSTHSFTITSAADVARMCSGPSEERSSEVCACDDVDGKSGKP